MKRLYIVMIALAGILLGFSQVSSMDKKMEDPMKMTPPNTRSAVFAGGCFWCTESDFEKVDGVTEVISGYTGGQVANPSYKEVSSGGTGHVEAVKVIYDPTRITYEALLDVFWRHVDPTDSGGQFVDRGQQYTSAIFYASEEERHLAEASKKKLADSGPFGKPIVTAILPLGPFYQAEDYHQDYYKKNPIRYNWYRSGSGRDQFVEKAWAGMPAAMKSGLGTGANTDMAAAKQSGLKSDMPSAMPTGGQDQMAKKGPMGSDARPPHEQPQLPPSQRHGTAPAIDPPAIQSHAERRHRTTFQQ
jgi:peptide methionine sulfoxide reductase msrA/msrB